MIKNLKLLREEKGWSQQKVADMLSLTQQTVFKYEQKSNESDIATLIQLADIFEVSVDFLIGNTDIREKNTNSKQPTLSKPRSSISSNIALCPIICAGVLMIC
ncbi:MAG: helix-turn-helix transcriptional regulator [Ruminiclostridium sp.]|nr:helix-turn-helix transcriptional regulator [Ruminiclostridium sp.]